MGLSHQCSLLGELEEKSPCFRVVWGVLQERNCEGFGVRASAVRRPTLKLRRQALAIVYSISRRLKETCACWKRIPGTTIMRHVPVILQMDLEYQLIEKDTNASQTRDVCDHDERNSLSS